MGDDDFDLFPKREHLDPFSFDSKEEEKDAQSEEEGQEKDAFFDDSQPLPEAPDAEPPGDIPAHDLPPDRVEDMPKPSIDDSEFDLPADFFSEEEPVTQEPFEEISESLPGPIPDEEPEQIKAEPELDLSTGTRTRRRGPSPFVVVGGALLVILLLLWGALTYLKRESRPVLFQKPPQATIKLRKPAPPPPPAREPAAEAPKSLQPGQGALTDEGKPETPAAVSDGTQGKPEAPPDKAVDKGKPAAEKIEAASVKVPKPKPVAPPNVAAVGSGYSVQVGALILKSSVRDLEKKLSAIGYDPFFKEGTTRATMNFISVGPLGKGEEQRALKRIRNTGIEANIRQSSKGTVIDAGGFLLSGNADRVSQRIRALGYPVKLERKEAQLPLTLIRVGRYGTKTEAAKVRDDLKKKGFDAIVVKLQ